MIKVLVPDMPTADELLPYLREIDAAKVYVNQGPLLRRLEARLEKVKGTPCRVVANGTVALELALRAMALPPGTGVLVPAVTFVASAQAIVNAGLRPVLADVNSRTWQLDADRARAIIDGAAGISAVMPVATFGQAVDVVDWLAFVEHTGLPVLIDAAGAIYEQMPPVHPSITVCFSLHATKAIGAGEGGVVMSINRELLDRVESLATFGPGGTNAKLSEYHAAVAHASLDRYESDRPFGLPETAGWYADHHLAKAAYWTLPGGRVPTLFPVLLPDGVDAAQVHDTLLTGGIETRQWYRPFLDERPEFAKCPRVRHLPNTDMLRKRMLGLPWHRFLTELDVKRVCTDLAKAIA